LPKIGCEEDSIVPEGVNRQLFTAHRRLPVFPTFDFEFDRLPDDFDRQIEEKISAANQEALFE
jgi:hypothetical protein